MDKVTPLSLNEALKQVPFQLKTWRESLSNRGDGADSVRFEVSFILHHDPAVLVVEHKLADELPPITRARIITALRQTQDTLRRAVTI